MNFRLECRIGLDGDRAGGVGMKLLIMKDDPDLSKILQKGFADACSRMMEFFNNTPRGSVFQLTMPQK